LLQDEFDALASFAGNSAGKLGRVAGLINKGDIRAALEVILSAVDSSSDVNAGLTQRRRCEVSLYLLGYCSCRYLRDLFGHW
jgi:GH24 family phage-related lysozyme (muramidase)